MDFCSLKHDFGISAKWVFFARSYCKSSCDGIGGVFKTTSTQAKPLTFFE